MPKKLIAKVQPETGMKMGLVGLLLAVFGTTLAFTVAPIVGYCVAVVGVLLGLVGVVLHFFKNWRQIFNLRD